MAQAVAGSIAFVTGANRGIGRAIVDALVAGGSKKIYAAARTLSTLESLQETHGAIIVPIQLDITNPAQVQAAVATAGDVNLLINNAGVLLEPFAKPFADVGTQASRDEMEVNVFGTLAVSQAFAPVLARNGGGALVNMASIASLVNFSVLVSYSASKAALHSMTQATRLALASQGTTVIGVYPGAVDTEMTADAPFDKVTPASVAEQIVVGINSGVEDLFPDPMSTHLGQLYTSEPKNLERAVAAMAG
jgi:NAD(P)-dependent dehydrogenase (short-subunit alcohol dehydrogenase family)